jgi:hypothetical protein
MGFNLNGLKGLKEQRGHDMLPNIDRALYVRFKKEGYKKKEYARTPVLSINEIVQLGYLDVNRTIRGIEPEQSRLFRQTVVSFLHDLLTNPPKNQQDFDLLHYQCCQQCLETSTAGKARIHYGQAQKLLNMSLKYLYNEFAVYYGKLNQFRFPDNNIEYFFHLPIDSQIRGFLVSNCNFVDPTLLPWSQWTNHHYISFQSQLRNCISSDYKPLEIDYLLWNRNGTSLGMAIT